MRQNHIPEIKNLKKAAQRIKKAVKNKEGIILFGDSDLDGVSSVIILQDTIKNLGGEIKMVYFPDREKEGYGLTETSLEYLKQFSPALLITVDCGIANFSEIELANKIGFEIIIVDHHEILNGIPEASIVVNPKQKGDKYPFKFFSAAGLSFKLAEEILEGSMSSSLRRNFLELAALATIADMMPEKDDNQAIIEEGLSYLEKTYRPGIAVFLDMPEILAERNTRMLVQEIISILNIVDPRDHLNVTYILLSISSLEEAKVLAKELLVKRDQKRLEIKQITSQIEEILARTQKEPIIFQANSAWPVALLGAVASRICSNHGKPTFLISKKEKNSRGTVRTPENIDGVMLLKKCSHHLLSFGGHPQAAGFTVENEKIDELKKCLIKEVIF